jgi:S1-C subfamily serine protease
MSTPSDWKVPAGLQPSPADYSYDLQRAADAMVGIRSIVPASATTAEVLGTERVGNGVVIKPGVVLTIGYLVTEAETIWLTLSDGRAVQGHTLGYDQATGFALVQMLARVDLPVVPLGSIKSVSAGERVVVTGAGGLDHCLAARVVAKQEFAGYWEYLLDEALFTSPAHPHWGGTAVLAHDGTLVGLGSLQVQHTTRRGQVESINMSVPIDLLTPIMTDLLTLGRANRPMRPWLGLFATENDGRVVVIGVSSHGPATVAGVEAGDEIQTVGHSKVGTLAQFYRAMWALGDAGCEVPLGIMRNGEPRVIVVTSADRTRTFKGPRLH